MDQTPEWADKQWSKELPALRARGEGQEIEYMVAFPQNARELAKEIAAFATTNPGTILIGVSDDGDLVGIADGQTPAGRDDLLERIGGVCRSTVKPSITPVAKFAVESEKTVLVLVVPKGAQPVYYASGVPYLRHLTQSRPAEPHEVLDLARLYFVSSNLVGEQEDNSDLRHLYSELARVLVNVLIYANEANDREFNPWLDMWRAEFGYAARDLRELAVRDVAIEEKIADEIIKLSRNLDEVARLPLYVGSGGEDLETLTDNVEKLAEDLKQRLIDTKPLGADSIKIVRAELKASARKLSELSARSEAMVDNGRIEEFQSEASSIGLRVLELSYFNIVELGSERLADIKRLGRILHLVETMPLYADGGLSMKAIQDTVVESGRQLMDLVETL